MNEGNGKAKTVEINGLPMSQYFHKRNAWKPVTRREIVDILEIFIDKATFAEAMNALDANIKRAIQGAVLEQMAGMLVAEQEQTTVGGIHLPPGMKIEP